MRKYLSTIHERPDSHKKLFAFAVSGTFTLFIFAIWTLTTFGLSGGESIAESDNVYIASADPVEQEELETSPFSSFRDNLALSLEAIKASFGEIKTGFESGLQDLESVDLDTEYQELRDGALDVYAE